MGTQNKIVFKLQINNIQSIRLYLKIKNDKNAKNLRGVKILWYEQNQLEYKF